MSWFPVSHRSHQGASINGAAIASAHHVRCRRFVMPGAGSFTFRSYPEEQAFPMHTAGPCCICACVNWTGVFPPPVTVIP